MLKQAAVDSINNQLDDIDLNESQRITLSDIDDNLELSHSYLSICASLLGTLSTLDNRAQKMPLNSMTNISHIYMAIKDLQPDFEESASLLKYRLINFLCNHLQV